MKPLKKVHDAQEYKPSAGSKPTSEQTLELTTHEVANFDMATTMDHCNNIRDQYTNIHSSIEAFYLLHGSISDAQLDTMKALLLTHISPAQDEKAGDVTLPSREGSS